MRGGLNRRGCKSQRVKSASQDRQNVVTKSLHGMAAYAGDGGKFESASLVLYAYTCQQVPSAASGRLCSRFEIHEFPDS